MILYKFVSVRKVLILTVLVLVVFAVSYGISSAAYDDVTLTTSTVITVNGVNMNVSGSSAVIKSIVVNANSFTVTLLSGSSIKVTSSSRRTLSANVANSDYVQNSCSSSQSSVTLTSDPNVSSATIAITPSSSACSTVAAATGGGGGGGGGGSGGCGGYVLVAYKTKIWTGTVTLTGGVGGVGGLAGVGGLGGGVNGASGANGVNGILNEYQIN